MASRTLISDTEAWKNLKVAGMILTPFSFFFLDKLMPRQSIFWMYRKICVWYVLLRRPMLRRLRRLIYVIWWAMLSDASQWWCMILHWTFRCYNYLYIVAPFLSEKCETWLKRWILDYCNEVNYNAVSNILLCILSIESPRGCCWTTHGSAPLLKPWISSSSWQRCVIEL